MKKIVWLFLFLLLIGCAGTPVKQSEDYSKITSYQMSPEALEKLMTLLSETGANKIRAFTGRTGGTSGKLDSISVSALSNNDLGLVFDVSDSSMYFYKFNSTATDTEDDPYFIRPDDYSSAGVWYLMTGFSFARSATPQWNFRDSGCTDTDANARIYVDCTDTGSGTEDCDFTIAVQIAGNLTDIIAIDADGNVSVSTLALNPSGGLLSQTPTTGDPGGWSMSGAVMYGGHFIATASGTGGLPAVAAGMNFCVEVEGAYTAILDPNSSDTIYLDGAAETQDENITSDGTSGAAVCCKYRSANAWSCLGYLWDGATD